MTAAKLVAFFALLAVVPRSYAAVDILGVANVASMLSSAGVTLDGQTIMNLVSIATNAAATGVIDTQQLLMAVANTPGIAKVDPKIIVAAVQAMGFNVNEADVQNFINVAVKGTTVVPPQTTKITGTTNPDDDEDDDYVDPDDPELHPEFTKAPHGPQDLVAILINQPLTAVGTKTTSAATGATNPDDNEDDDYVDPDDPELHPEFTKPPHGPQDLVAILINQPMTKATTAPDSPSNQNSGTNSNIVQALVGSAVAGRYMNTQCTCSCFTTLMNGQAVTNDPSPPVAPQSCPARSPGDSAYSSTNMGGNCYCQCCGGAKIITP